MNRINIDGAQMQNHTQQSPAEAPFNKSDQKNFENALEGDQETQHNKQNVVDTKNSKEQPNFNLPKNQDQQNFKGLTDPRALIEPKKFANAQHAKQEQAAEHALKQEDQSGAQSMQALYSSQQSLINQLQGSAPATATQGLDNSANLEATAKLAESILVSQPNAENQEVRIKVSQDILQQTEIIIARLEQGGLQVTLVTDNERSWQTLVQGQHELREMLAKDESDVKVKVQTTEESQAESNDQQKRSRGLNDLQENENDN